MNLRMSALLVLVGMSSLTGCTKPPVSVFADEAFYHARHPYRIGYVEKEAQRLLGADWRLDNFVVDSAGKVTADKAGDEYRTKNWYDYEADGKFDESENVPVYDLRFTHRKKDAEIWLRTGPMSVESSEKELEVLLNKVVDGVSGSIGVSVFSSASRATELLDKSGGGAVGVSVKVEKRFATRIIETRKATLSGVEALAATFEVANVDQLELSPDARWERRRVVILRPSFSLIRMTKGPADKPPISHAFKVLMVIAYRNQADDFEALLPEFANLLGRIQFLDDERAGGEIARRLAACLPADQASAEMKVTITPVGDLQSAELQGVARSKELGQCEKRSTDALRYFGTGEKRELLVSVPPKTPLDERFTYVEEGPETPVVSDQERGAVETPESQPAPETAQGAVPVTE